MTAALDLSHDWSPVPVPGNARFGERCWLHSAEAFLHCRSARPDAVTVGDRTSLYASTAFALGPDGSVAIGKDCVITSLISTNGAVRLGDHVLTGVDSVIADVAYAVPGVAPDPRDEGAGEDVVVGDLAWIGARAVVLGGARIGRAAIVGAGAVVRGEVPDGAIVAGNPARIVGRAA